MSILDSINTPEDLKKVSEDSLIQLCQEIRQKIIDDCAENPGHLGSSLGVVELTVALHYILDTPYDNLVWDVGHQSYAHKILTGRKEQFKTKRIYGGISGFPKISESEYDSFGTGHSSTSISAALGMAIAAKINGETGRQSVAVIGDGSLSGGEALEGLDYAGEFDGNFIIVVNDNDMSIAENHGGLYKNLKLLRDTDGKAECNLFKAMGLDYVFVKDGNDIEQLISAFESVKDIDHPVVVHICTQKGKGYAPAEKDKENWHWCMPFDIETGRSKFEFDGESYDDITVKYLLDKMKNDKSVAVITSGTPTVAGFTKDKRDIAGKQFIDVGIAEEHAVALASGMAKNGAKPVYGVYSSFIQRTYDQISQDLCINSNPVTIIVFAASVFGMNDVTHLGIYDIAMLSNIPNLVYLAPTCKEEYLAMVEWSMSQRKYPVAIRVPGNGVVSNPNYKPIDFDNLNKYSVTKEGGKVAILGLGTFYQLGESVADEIKKQYGIDATVVNPVYITGTDEDLLAELAKTHDVVITLEDGILNGGFGEKIARFYGKSDVKVFNYGLKKEFLDRYDYNEVLAENHLTKEQICEDIKDFI